MIPIVALSYNQIRRLNEGFSVIALTDSTDPPSTKLCPAGMKFRQIPSGETVCFSAGFPTPQSPLKRGQFACISQAFNAEYPYMGLPSCLNYESYVKDQIKSLECPRSGFSVIGDFERGLHCCRIENIQTSSTGQQYCIPR